MYKMINAIQHYAWGSDKALTEYYGIANPERLPMAELWMGAHASNSSKIIINGVACSLRMLIESNPTRYLGKAVSQCFTQLPFLVKVLCAEHPLSIQVHPNRAAAEAGFKNENRLGIPIDSPTRNYKDTNHKPELVYAITPFKALNGFREFNEIVQLLKPLQTIDATFQSFINEPNEETLKHLFTTILTFEGEILTKALIKLMHVCQQQIGEPWQTIQEIAKIYPNDKGLFCPLLLNIITLKSEEAMFLEAETPHAYLHGMALEIMANSDNVLRAGLTPKFIDVHAVLANVKFNPKPFHTLLLSPTITHSAFDYRVPVEDFSFTLYKRQSSPISLPHASATIIFCLEGEAVLKSDLQSINLVTGESCFIAADETSITLSTTGNVARIYNKLVSQ